MPERRLLVAVTDRRLFRRSPAEWAAAAIEGGVDLIQIREKDLDDDALLAFARDIAAAAQPRSIQINSNAHVATRIGAGLHLPESAPRNNASGPGHYWLKKSSDCALPLHRRNLASRSVHSVEAGRAASGVDFIVAGHIFATPSHANEEPRGLDWLEEVARAASVPVVAIGGITAENAAECIARGAAGVAVISAIAASDDPISAARALRDAIDR